jgi:hypothetical protein
VGRQIRPSSSYGLATRIPADAHRRWPEPHTCGTGIVRIRLAVGGHEQEANCHPDACQPRQIGLQVLQINAQRASEVKGLGGALDQLPVFQSYKVPKSAPATPATPAK